MMHMLKTKWMAAVLGAITFSATVVMCLQPAKQLQAKAAVKSTEVLHPPEPSWAFRNPELDQMIEELRAEKESLKSKAQQLAEWEARLQSEKKEIMGVTQKVCQLQAELDKSILRVTEEETVNLKRLSKMYATMAPEAAAKILRESPDDQAVKILAVMKEAESAPLLEALAQGSPADAKRAAAFSSRLRLTQSRPTNDKPKTP